MKYRYILGQQIYELKSANQFLLSERDMKYLEI